MSDEQNLNQEDQVADTEYDNDIEDLSPEKEKEMLMNKARVMGLKVSNNIGLDTLRDRIKEAQEPKTETNVMSPEVSTEPKAQVNALTGNKTGKKVRMKSLRQHMHDENMKLVRIRVTCMNPGKSDLQGEIITVANESLGTVRKFVPFGDLTDDGYHVPYCIYKQMKNKQFWQKRTVKIRGTKEERIESVPMKEFSIEILPQLTRDELNQLATAQQAAGSFN